MGEVKVYLDGEEQETVSCYKTGGRTPDAVYSVSGLENKEHTLRLEKVSGRYMIVDYFEVTVPTGLGDVTGIELVQQPSLVYDEGQPLDLSALKILVTYENGAEKLLSYDDADIQVSVAGGRRSRTAMSTADYNGKLWQSAMEVNL